MIRVSTASRLHFGLISFPTRSHWPNLDGDDAVLARRFGGVGMMIEDPGLSVSVEPAREWSAEGPLASRALEFARKFESASALNHPHHVTVATNAIEHVGLGTGTQLGLAVAKALAVSAEIEMNAARLASCVGRGLRSGLGIHGFEQGGFLVEAGQGSPATPAPLVARCDFPEDWRVVLVVPTQGKGLHGAGERQAFRDMDQVGVALSHSEALCRLVLLGMLPALSERDFPAFSEALFDFNARVGEAFSAYQQGRYADARVEGLIAMLRKQGYAGVAQSSWGPTVAVLARDAEEARRLAEKLGAEHDVGARMTRACNTGARVERS